MAASRRLVIDDDVRAHERRYEVNERYTPVLQIRQSAGHRVRDRGCRKARAAADGDSAAPGHAPGCQAGGQAAGSRGRAQQPHPLRPAAPSSGAGELEAGAHQLAIAGDDRQPEAASRASPDTGSAPRASRRRARRSACAGSSPGPAFAHVQRHAPRFAATTLPPSPIAASHRQAGHTAARCRSGCRARPRRARRARASAGPSSPRAPRSTPAASACVRCRSTASRASSSMPHRPERQAVARLVGQRQRQQLVDQAARALLARRDGLAVRARPAGCRARP